MAGYGIVNITNTVSESIIIAIVFLMVVDPIASLVFFVRSLLDFNML